MPKKKAPTPPHEILYKKLVENMNEAVWMGDRNERTVYANPKFCQLLGYTLEEILGKESYGFWDTESIQRVKYVNKHHRAKGVSSSYEGRLVTKGGEKVPVLINGTPLPDGGTIGIITDIRELKKKEAAEKILTSAVEYATDAIMIFDKEGVVASWNTGAKLLFGYRRDEIVGKSIKTILPKENLVSLLQLNSVLYNTEFRGRHKNRHFLTIAGTLTPLFGDEKNNITHFLFIGRDITNEKKFSEELSVKYQKLKDAYNKFGIVRRQMDYVFELLEQAHSGGTQSMQSVADFIVSSTIMLTRVDACVLRIYNKTKNTMDLLSLFGLSSDWQGKKTIKFTKSLGKKAFLMGQPLKIIDITKEHLYHGLYLAKKHNLSSLLLIPLGTIGNPIGTLSLYSRPERKLEIFENEFIEKYARVTEIVLETVMQQPNQQKQRRP